ncbi:uncharacterized protein C8A04DRAFT_32674 [Dichotomopilus funicola]|uniref:NACHT domain-containing protein n=1 Tax=Dichotomopilus funicola TaxID=1934379 RepID=A0AAN6UV90_9PEZI|nr:hypothetical protein C8A04DRAFT_32674 [Dichotomopilus funicola]
MLDPLTAIALSGNILQFIDYATKLLREARQISRSATGAAEGTRDAIAVYDDFREAAAALATPSTLPRTADDAAMEALAERCREVSEELVAGLKRLQVATPGSRRESLRVAWRVMREKGELEELEVRLERCRKQLVTRIIFMMSQKQSSTYRGLQELKSQSDDSTTKTTDKLDTLSQELLHLSQIIETNGHATASHINDLQDEMRVQEDRTVQKMVDLISEITTTKTKVEKERQILRKLTFHGIRRREDAIEPARAGTYRWLLYPPSEALSRKPPNSDPDEQVSKKKKKKPKKKLNDESNFEEVIEALFELRKIAIKSVTPSTHERKETSQLKADTRARFLTWLEAGSGIFYLSGKPGAGKSTMMKFLAREQRTLSGLQTWAGDKQLVFASFFFWRSGIGIQRSIEGLYRGLLWETLKACPELMPHVFPYEWNTNTDTGSNDTEFALSEIEAAFERLIGASSTTSDRKICFFIDGLDEFEGDHLGLAHLLKQWANLPHIKLCVSSRPYSAFENIFNTEPDFCLRLHEHTYQDMIQAAQEELRSAITYSGVVVSPSNLDGYDILIKPAVAKANGVFLWLRLAIRHLVRGIGNAYSATELGDMLHAMPEDVSVMFQTMLDRLLARPDRVRVAITLLSLADPSLPKGQHRLVVYFSAMDDVLDGAIGLDDLLASAKNIPKGSDNRQMEKRLVVTEARLRGRCEDFIEIRDDGYGKDTSRPLPLRRRIEFVHRDLRDFLVQEHIIQRLHQVAGWSAPKMAGLHRYLGIVLLRTVPSLAKSESFLDQLTDEFFHSESTTAPELELLLSLIIINSAQQGPKAMGRRHRYCIVLAAHDDVTEQHVERTVHYSKERAAPPLFLALEFMSAAAFHRHDSYVISLTTRFPILLQLHHLTSILLSASLGGAAALATTYQRKHANSTPDNSLAVRRRKGLMKAIAGSDHAINPGGGGSLLYPQTATEMFAFPGFDPNHDSNPNPGALSTFDADTIVSSHSDDGDNESIQLRRGSSPPLALATALLKAGAEPNTPLPPTYFSVPSWPCLPSSLNSLSITHWTPWTATLLCLFGVLRRNHGLLLPASRAAYTDVPDDTMQLPVLSVMEMYLTHGADTNVCFVGRCLPKEKLKPVPVWRVGPGVYASVKMEEHIPDLFTESRDEGEPGEDGNREKDGGKWRYLTLGQVVDMVGDDHNTGSSRGGNGAGWVEQKKRVKELLRAKGPWAVTKWIGTAAQSLGGVWQSAGASGNLQNGNGPNAEVIEKIELEELGDSYFFVGMIVREQELGRLVVPKEAKSRLLPASLIPI